MEIARIMTNASIYHYGTPNLIVMSTGWQKRAVWNFIQCKVLLLLHRFHLTRLLLLAMGPHFFWEYLGENWFTTSHVFQAICET